MKAKFSTTCFECGDQIKTGKEILKNSSGRWVHKHCSDKTEELP